MTNFNLNIRFSDKLDSYQDFFDKAWLEQIDKIINGTKYEKIIFELNTSWYGISATRRLPWLLVYSIKNSVEIPMFGVPCVFPKIIKKCINNCSLDSLT